MLGFFYSFYQLIRLEINFVVIKSSIEVNHVHPFNDVVVAMLI